MPSKQCEAYGGNPKITGQMNDYSTCLSKSHEDHSFDFKEP